MKPLIDIEHAAFTYPGTDRPALEEVDLAIMPGELVGIVGQNGSGKTTLTKLMNGLLKPTRGRVRIAGEETSHRSVQEIARTIGYVFQNPNHQLFARTVRAELEFGPRNIGVPQGQIDERVARVVEFFGLAEVIDKHPYRCSFPYRKLIGIASVVTMEPSLIILDEPTTGQDHTTTHIINELMRDLARTGTTIVCVSHDMPLLSDIVDRVVVMRDARVIADATPQHVFSDVELMRRTNLSAPQVTQLSLETSVPRGAPIALRVRELVDDLAVLTEEARNR